MNYCLKKPFLCISISGLLALAGCLHDATTDATKTDAIKNDNGPKQLVDCQTVKEADLNLAWDRSGGDYGAAGYHRILAGSSFELMRLTDIGSSWEGLFPWLEAQKNKEALRKLYTQWPGVQDIIKKSNIELAKAFYCVNKKSIAMIKESTMEYDVKLQNELKISCKDALGREGLAWPQVNTRYANCREEYISLYLDLFALENNKN